MSPSKRNLQPVAEISSSLPLIGALSFSPPVRRRPVGQLQRGAEGIAALVVDHFVGQLPV
jgi:hypothetical protein